MAPIRRFVDVDYEADRLESQYDDNWDFRFKGYWLVKDIERDDDFEVLHYSVGTENYGEFMLKLLEYVKRNRRFGWVRVFMDDYGFSYLMRKFNLYINAIHNGTDLYEIGFSKDGPKFFQTNFFTEYGPDYKFLLGGKKGIDNLKKLELGYNVLSNSAKIVGDNLDNPREWGASIAVFVLTFPEAGRFRWTKDDLAVIMEKHMDIKLEGPYEYMAILPKQWGPVSRVGYRARRLSEEEDKNLETRTPDACKELLKTLHSPGLP